MNTFRHFIKWQLGLARAETQTTPAERDSLAAHATGRRCIVEVGVWHGVTTCRLRAVMASNGILHAIDPYPVGRLGISLQRRIAHAEVAKVRNGRVVWNRATGAEAARELESELVGKVDFLFIDGEHSYEGLRADWEGWARLVAPDGLIALHDSRSTPARPIDDAGSVRFTRDVILNDPQFEVANLIDSLTVLRKLPE